MRKFCYRHLMGWRLCGCAVLLSSTVLISPASAQLVPSAPVAPPRGAIDENNVDRATGNFVFPTSDISIGEPGQAGLIYKRSWLGKGWRANTDMTVTLTSTGVSVNIGSETHTFTHSGSTFISDQQDGTTLTSTTGGYTFTDRDGTIVTFVNGDPSLPVALATSVRKPSGEILTFSLYSHAFNILPPSWPAVTVSRVNSVTSSFGYKLDFTYVGDAGQYPADMVNFTTVSKVTASNLKTGASPWPSVSFGYTPNAVGPTQETVTDPLGRVTIYSLDVTSGRITAIKRPGDSATSETIAYGSDGRVSSITKNGYSITYIWTLSGTTLTGTSNDSLGRKRITTANSSLGVLLTDTNALNQVTTYVSDTHGRVTKIIPPEGSYTAGYTQYTYDARGNITEMRKVSKTAGAPPDIVVSAYFPSSCTNAVTCNKPTWTKDANGYQTDYVYDPSTGQIVTETAPAPGGTGARPTTSYLYATVDGASLLSATTTCATAATCAGTANEIKRTVNYNSNGLPTVMTIAAGDGSQSASTANSYDKIGNVLTVDGPLAGTGDTTTYRYDDARQLTGIISADPDGSGPLKRQARRLTYNNNGDISKAEVGTVVGTDDASWSAFASKQQLTTTFDSYGRKVRNAVTAGGNTQRVTDYSFDSAGRPDCTAERMNSAIWGTLTPACSAQTTGGAGPDRITKITLYDKLNRISEVTTGYGTSDASVEKAGYTPNGSTNWVIDGANNKTTYVYDGFDRLSKIEYPSPTKGSGTSSTTDYEQLGYDANGNVTTRRLRDGQSISYGYDHLNRLISKNLPGGEPDVTYAYDLLGRRTSASQSGNALSFTYDALGRPLTETGPQGTLTSTWDAGGRRTKLQWPDGFYVIYDYDTLGEMIKVRENGATTGVGVLASYSYDDLGNRTAATYGNGTTSSWTPDAVSRLSSLVQNLAGASYDLTRTFTYNPASQITSATSSNDAYAWNAAANVNRSYTANGLNQYTASGSTSLGYDARGNLTTSGSDSYTYSSENLMKTGPGSTSLSYDPLLRLYQVTQGSSTTRFAYDGLEMVAEYNASNALQKRYVFGPGTDDPIVQYAGTGTTSRTWLMADERGSVIALTDSSGNKVAINSYDEYGIPGSANSGRFQYTGQTWLPEIGMYYYKARMYSPSLGRFMQTDPIGYQDGLNWYNYVGGDPINDTDSTGLLLDQWDWSCYGNCGGGYWNSPLPSSPSVSISSSPNSDGSYSWTTSNGYSGTWDPNTNSIFSPQLGTYSNGSWDSIIVTGEKYSTIDASYIPEWGNSFPVANFAKDILVTAEAVNLKAQSKKGSGKHVWIVQPLASRDAVWYELKASVGGTEVHPSEGVWVLKVTPSTNIIYRSSTLGGGRTLEFQGPYLNNQGFIKFRFAY